MEFKQQILHKTKLKKKQMYEIGWINILLKVHIVLLSGISHLSTDLDTT